MLVLDARERIVGVSQNAARWFSKDTPDLGRPASAYLDDGVLAAVSLSRQQPETVQFQRARVCGRDAADIRAHQ